jgi:hypothetical protein
LHDFQVRTKRHFRPTEPSNQDKAVLEKKVQQRSKSKPFHGVGDQAKSGTRISARLLEGTIAQRLSELLHDKDKVKRIDVLYKFPQGELKRKLY